MSARAVRTPIARAHPGGWTMAHQQQVARFHRERDRRRLLTMIRTLASAALLVVLVLSVVGLRMHQVRLSYRLDGLRSAKTQMEESRSRLRVELDTLKSLARVEGKARTELGMGPPAGNQVRLAREYVPTGDGLTMTVPLTAAADRSTPSHAGSALSR